MDPQHITAALASALAILAGAGVPPTRAAPTYERPPISYEDYPEEALRAEQQGVVEVRLDIGKTGKATGCRILHSSGVPSLDAATCTLLQARAAFAPARDATGKAVADTYDQKIAWRIAAGHAREPALDAAAQAWVDCLLAEAGPYAAGSDSADAVADRAFASCPEGERGLVAAIATVVPEGATPVKEVPPGLRAAIRQTVIERIARLRAEGPTAGSAPRTAPPVAAPHRRD